MSPSPELQQLALFFWRSFLVVTLQNNNRHTSARAQKMFPIRNMRPLSIRDPPTWGTAVFPPALGSGTGKLIRRREDWIRACERSVSGAKNGAERPENRVERSGAVSGRGRKTMERSGARSAEREVAERERRVERAQLAAHSPLQRNISLISKVYHNVVLHSPHYSTVYTSTANSLNITQPKAF